MLMRFAKHVFSSVDGQIIIYHDNPWNPIPFKLEDPQALLDTGHRHNIPIQNFLFKQPLDCPVEFSVCCFVELLPLHPRFWIINHRGLIHFPYPLPDDSQLSLPFRNLNRLIRPFELAVSEGITRLFEGIQDTIVVVALKFDCDVLVIKEEWGLCRGRHY